MAKKRTTADRYVQPYRYPSPHVPLSAIRRFARQIAVRFHPQKIVLFGSYAYGEPHAESDVDLLVIMPSCDVVNQSIRITSALDEPFELDLMVRTPQQIQRGLREGDCDWFLREVMEKGKVLYEAPRRTMGAQSRGGHGSGKGRGRAGKAQTRRSVLPLSASGGIVSQVLCKRPFDTPNACAANCAPGLACRPDLLGGRKP